MDTDRYAEKLRAEIRETEEGITEYKAMLQTMNLEIEEAKKALQCLQGEL